MSFPKIERATVASDVHVFLLVVVTIWSAIILSIHYLNQVSQ